MTETQLRQAVLMVCVLDGVDLTPHEGGVVLPATPGTNASKDIFVSWERVAGIVGETDDPTNTATRSALTQWFTLARDLCDSAVTLESSPFFDQFCVIALPHDCDNHPGQEWVRDVVPGELIHRGLGIKEQLHLQRQATVVPAGLLELLDLDPQRCWESALDYLDTMAQLASKRHKSDPSQTLRPMGSCDVITLLGSTTFRTALASHHEVGMRALAVPMRTRGWVDPNHLDSAFTRGAAAATTAQDRGFSVAVLVTADGVWPAKDGSNLVEFALRGFLDR